MDDRRLVRVSKYLAKHLRHQPERLGLELDEGGWVDVDALLRACARNGVALTRADLEEVVARNDKRRFSFDAAGTRIRANQGHSVPVDLGLPAVEPPPTLYHGTNERALRTVLAEGLRPMGRHHVHLSPDVETARRVGARRGRPVVLVVDAAALHRTGATFSVSDNGVWLVAEVPPGHLRILRDAESGG
jgi:putative RNA 2'-phosphotransferase